LNILLLLVEAQVAKTLQAAAVPEDLELVLYPFHQHLILSQ
jgi:hypothetical protein